VFMARIVSVSARDDLIDENGRLCLDRADLMAYAHGEYFALGRKLGKFGFSAAKRQRRTSAKAGSPRGRTSAKAGSPRRHTSVK